ncbi:MAG: AzlC family ABC transporter permease, partial [Candidatus Dormibacteria bacterium]
MDTRASVVRNSIGIGLATGAYAVSFGAISTAAHLSVIQTCALSLLMFTGASQFALVGVLGAGGGVVAAATTAALLGSRNALYALRLSSLLDLRGWRRPVAAQLVIDESTAMATVPGTEGLGRVGFWATGAAVFTFWNLGT